VLMLIKAAVSVVSVRFQYTFMLTVPVKRVQRLYLAREPLTEIVQLLAA